MKKDTEVKLHMQERRKGITQRIDAARAGISERTARKYEHEGKLPIQLKRPHNWNTHTDPFGEDWPLFYDISRFCFDILFSDRVAYGGSRTSRP